MSKVKAVPDGYTTVTVDLVVKNESSLEFYKKAFGAEEKGRHVMDGHLMHAVLKIGNSMVMFHQEMPEWGAKTPADLKFATNGLYLYVEDCDAAFAQAVKAGAKVKMPVMDMFWGDRGGVVIDPSGHSWMISTHKKDVTPEELKRGGEDFMKQMTKQKPALAGS